MKRIFCLALSVLLFAAMLAGCQSDTVSITTAGGTTVDADPGALGEIQCIGAVNAEEDFNLSGEKAKELLERLKGLCKKETGDTEPAANMIHMSFSAPFNGDTAWLGEYTVQDNGVILYSSSPHDNYIHGYTCDKSEYDAILQMVQ